MIKTNLNRLFATTLVSSLIIFSSLSPTNAATTKLTDKDILSALLKNADVLLKDATHCNIGAVDKNDHTIGDYLSGFWAQHTNKDGKNWIDINTSETAQGYTFATIKLYRHEKGVDLGHGISFFIDKNKKIKRDSFSCIG